MLKKISEAVGRADWSLHMMIMSCTKCILGIENQCPFWLLDILSWVFSKKLGSQKADGACKRQMGHQKKDVGAKKAEGHQKRQMGCHKADGVP
jgi:hypothetical protein